jgi:hypothetical protein
MGNIYFDYNMVASAGLILFVLLFIFVLILWRKLNFIQKKYNAMIGHNGVANLEEVITELQRKLKQVHDNNLEHERAIRQITSKVSEMKGNVSIHRYNAFSENGSDLSFSIAIVDDHLDGLVFTVIHGREESYTYGKPLEKGLSKYALSPEELQVINLAQSKSLNHVLKVKNEGDSSR